MHIGMQGPALFPNQFERINLILSLSFIFKVSFQLFKSLNISINKTLIST